VVEIRPHTGKTVVFPLRKSDTVTLVWTVFLFMLQKFGLAFTDINSPLLKHVTFA
jgi:hypothetical protein